MIYIGVGPGPVKQTRKGGWEEDATRLSKENEQLEAYAAGTFPGPGLWSNRYHVAFIILVS